MNLTGQTVKQNANALGRSSARWSQDVGGRGVLCREAKSVWEVPERIRLILFRWILYRFSLLNISPTFSMAFPPSILFLVLPCPPRVLRVPIFLGGRYTTLFLRMIYLHRTSRHQACWRFWRVFDSVRLSWRFSKVVAGLCHALLCGDNYWKSFGCGEGECLADVCPMASALLWSKAATIPDGIKRSQGADEWIQKDLHPGTKQWKQWTTICECHGCHGRRFW